MLHKHLKDDYDIEPDEMPYQLSTILRDLEEVFGVLVVKSIGSDIAKRLYNQLGLRFVTRSNYTFEDYIEEAEKLLLFPE